MHGQFVKIGVQEGRDALRHICDCCSHVVVKKLRVRVVVDSVIVCGATAIAEGGVDAVGLFKRAWGVVSDA